MRATYHILRPLLLAGACSGLALASGPAPAGPATQGVAPHRPGEILIRFLPGAGASGRAAVRGQAGAVHLRTFRSGAEHWRLGPGRGAVDEVARLRGHPLVEFAEPNYLVTMTAAPDDPLYPQQASLENIGQTGGVWGVDVEAEHAWEIATGTAGIVVAILDTGMDTTHPDLAPNLWTNPGEIAGNGLDDDGNGYVDDIHGWDFVNNDADPSDDRGHGTHVSGIIGAAGNNGLGVAGVAWRVSLMPLKFLDEAGVGTTADAAAALEYATLKGAHISNNSWGGGGFSSVLREAIRSASAAGRLFIASAGNSSRSNDQQPTYPASYDLRNVIAVAALDDAGALAAFSNFGATTVHLAAPGVSVLSTLPGGAYGRLSGTSMSAPHVTGAAVLLKVLAPQMTPREVRQHLMATSIPDPALAGLVVSGGRLSSFRPLAEPDLVPPGPVLDLAVLSVASDAVVLAWTAPGDDGNAGRADSYRVFRRQLSEGTTEDESDSVLLGVARPAVAGSLELVEVPGLAFDADYELSVTALDEWGNEGPAGNTVLARTLPAPVLALPAPELRLQVPAGRIASLAVTIANPSEGTLDWRLVLPPSVFADSGDGDATAASGPAPGKGEPDLRSGAPVADGFGGPDGFGYRFSDSDAGNGPPFQWTDLAGATPIAGLTGDDQVSGSIPLGFSFPFYGASYDAVWVHTNGYLTFKPTTPAYANRPLPSTQVPYALVAPFWDDLRFGGQLRATYAGDGQRFTVQFTEALPLGGSGSYTFQVELRDSGDMAFRYLRMTGPVDLATVGIQDPSGTMGLPIAFNNAYLRDRLAVKISSLPIWLTAQQDRGRIAPGTSVRPLLRVDARELAMGTYSEWITLRSNDPERPEVEIPLVLEVTPPDRLRPLRGECLAPRAAANGCDAAPGQGGARR